MRAVKQLRVIIFMLFFSPLVLLAEDVHVIKERETLSEVLYRLSIKPLYGKRGTVAQTIELNPWIKLRRRRLLYPGDVVVLPASSERSVASEIVPPLLEQEKISEDPTLPIAPPEDDSSALEVGLGSSSMRVSSKEANGDGHLEASNALRLDARYGLSTGSTTTYLGVGHTSVGFESPPDRTLKSPRLNLLDRYLGLRHSLSESLRLDYRLGQQDQTFYRSLNLTTLKLDRIPVFYGQIAADVILQRSSSTIKGLRFLGRYHAPFTSNDYKGKSGHGYQLGAFLEKAYERFQLRGNLFWSHDEFRLKEIDFTREDFGVGLGLTWDLDPEVKK